MENISSETYSAYPSQSFFQPPIAERLPLRIKWLGFWFMAGGLLLPFGIPAMNQLFPESELVVGAAVAMGNIALILSGIILLAVAWPYSIFCVEKLREGDYLVHWKYDRSFLRQVARQKMKDTLPNLVIWPLIGGLIWCVYWMCDLMDPVLKHENYGSMLAFPWFAGISVGLGVMLTATGLLRAQLFAEMTPHVVIGKTCFYFNNHILDRPKNPNDHPPRIETRNDIDFLVMTSLGQTQKEPIYVEHFIPVPTYMSISKPLRYSLARKVLA